VYASWPFATLSSAMTTSGKGLAKGTKIGEGLNFSRWVVNKKLGEGGFAEVYEVTDTITNEKVGPQFLPPTGRQLNIFLLTYGISLRLQSISRYVALKMLALHGQPLSRVFKVV
jgi:hypothetical protein